MKKPVYILVFFVAVAAALSFQNCSGTRTLTTGLNITQSQVDTQLQALKSSGSAVASSSGTSSSSASALDTFFNLYQTEGRSIYYSEAPGDMGKMDAVMPLDFKGLGASEVPTAAKAYFVIAGNQGALLITSGTTTETVIAAMASNTAGSFGDNDFTLNVTDSSGGVEQLYTTDIVDEDLAQVIQFDIDKVSENGQMTFAGFLTLEEPQN